MKRFSIITPTYNSKISLNNTLEALNYQSGYTSDDYEVIVADDGSSDGTYEYIKNTPKNYTLKHLYLERCPQSCRSRARNEGRKIAQGEIIIFLDSDMIVKRDFLSEVDRYFRVNDKLLLLGTRLMVKDPIRFDEIKTQKVFERYPFDPKQYDRIEYRYYLFEKYSYNANAIVNPWIHVYSCIIIVAKKWIDELDMFDENIAAWGMEDLEFGYLLYKKGLQFAVNPKLEMVHQNHGERNDVIVEMSKVEGYDKNIDIFLNKHPEAFSVRRSIAHKFFRGEIPMNKLNFCFPKKDVYYSYKNGTDIGALKKEIMHYASMDGLNIILEDFKEDGNLDLWVQCLGKTKSVIRYYPQSKRLNAREMEVFIAAEQKRQRAPDKAPVAESLARDASMI
jgi:glycosyltransferase involved in cell wall biosynthesis